MDTNDIQIFVIVNAPYTTQTTYIETSSSYKKHPRQDTGYVNAYIWIVVNWTEPGTTGCVYNHIRHL